MYKIRTGYNIILPIYCGHHRVMGRVVTRNSKQIFVGNRVDDGDDGDDDDNNNNDDDKNNNMRFWRIFSSSGHVIII